VRPARRPPGWNAPGPQPQVPSDLPEVWPGPGEELCFLTGDWRILQLTRGHRWSLDDLVTAWFAAEQLRAEPPERILDLGCGIGAVLLMLAWCFPTARCTGIEAQASCAMMARRSVAWNGVGGRCEVRSGDLRQPDVVPEGPVYGLVTGTPPYLPAGAATRPRRPQQGACHIEDRGGIESYCEAACRAMAPDAPFVVCHAWPQARRVERAARAAGLVLHSRVDVIPRSGKQPLFSVFAMRRGGALVCPPGVCELVVRDTTGRRTEAFRELRARMGMPA
jgi:tRNA1Val (adenine37-N6)-methyltransferase